MCEAEEIEVEEVVSTPMKRERKTCSRCGENPALYAWSMTPCALGREIKGKLCRRCDIDMNTFVLSFFRVKGRRELMEKYCIDG